MLCHAMLCCAVIACDYSRDITGAIVAVVVSAEGWRGDEMRGGECGLMETSVWWSIRRKRRRHI